MFRLLGWSNDASAVHAKMCIGNVHRYSIRGNYYGETFGIQFRGANAAYVQICICNADRS